MSFLCVHLKKEAEFVNKRYLHRENGTVRRVYSLRGVTTGRSEKEMDAGREEK